jgi:hypothetical protein
MPSTNTVFIRGKRLIDLALLVIVGYAVLGPTIHPSVALGWPLRADLLLVAAFGFLAPRPGTSRAGWRGGGLPLWVLPVVVGCLFGATVMAPLAAAPWILPPAVAMLWAGKGAPRRRTVRWVPLLAVVLGASLNGAAVGVATARGLRIPTEEMARQDFRVNDLLADIPLHDAWAVDLEGSHAPTLEELAAAMRHQSKLAATPAFLGLGMIRGAAGALFGWEEARWADPDASFLHRLSETDLQLSSSEPGTSLGIWRVLYAFTREGLVETINGTVHVAVSGAVGQGPEGPRLFLSFRVREVNWTTPFYLRLIDPARRYFIYPFLLRQLAHTWSRNGQPSIASVSTGGDT